jgi:hypothetical protein
MFQSSLICSFLTVYLSIVKSFENNKFEIVSLSFSLNHSISISLFLIEITFIFKGRSLNLYFIASTISGNGVVSSCVLLIDTSIVELSKASNLDNVTGMLTT